MTDAELQQLVRDLSKAVHDGVTPIQPRIRTSMSWAVLDGPSHVAFAVTLAVPRALLRLESLCQAQLAAQVALVKHLPEGCSWSVCLMLE
jgi:hypothetical protein